MKLGTDTSLLEGRIWVGEGISVALDSRVLLGMVFEAVQQVEWPKRRAGVPGTVPDPVLRTVQTYCYAAGILSSEGIEAAAVHDETVRYLCANHRPSWEVVREFRRANTPFLIQALSILFLNMSRFSLQNINPPLEAQRRLARAMQADSAAMDD